MDPGTAMDLFPPGGFVRLRARDRNNFIYADEDTVGVSLRPLRGNPPINFVWIAEHWYPEGGEPPYITLQSAAYGRYLVVTNQRRPPQRGFLVVQRDYDCPNLDPRFAWRPYRRVQGGHVMLSNPWDCFLRGNGAPVPYHVNPRPWVVTAHRSLSMREEWEVQLIPASPEPLPLAPPPPAPPALDVIAGMPDAEAVPQGRTIRYARANALGDVELKLADWPELVYEGRSVFELRTLVGLRQPDWLTEGIILLVWAGLNARPTPLVADLPLNNDPMYIVVYISGSQGAADLRYPQLDHPQPEPDNSPSP